jgi:hypothetical protein
MSSPQSNTHSTTQSIIKPNTKQKASLSKIKITDIIDLNGRIYYIPDKYIDCNTIGYEYVKVYKFILAAVIDSNLASGKIKDITKITKSTLTTYINTCDKIFTYIITGKLNTTIQFSTIETSIIKNIPVVVIPKLNPNIIERLE